MIDVVVPAYNAIRYLPNSIDSVLTQTHEHLLLYVVDDGSTDGTAEYVHALSDPRIRYIHKENGGQASARNVGIRASASPYIALLDADDVWYPRKLEKQLAVLKRHPELGLVHGFHDIIDADGAYLGLLEHDLRGCVFDRLLEGNLVNGSASMVLVPRDVFKKVGLFREDFPIGEDWDMWLRIARAYPVDYVPERIMAIRSLEEGMQSDRIKMADGRVRMFEVMSRYFALRGKARQKLAVECLSAAAYDYALAGRLWRSLTVFQRMARTAPLRTARLHALQFYFWVLVRALRERRA